MNKKITFKELAELSNVSVGTLSRYFNEGSLSKEKSLIIAKNIKKYKFIRNSAASKIRGKSNEVIILRTVVVSSSLDNIIAGIIDNIDGEVSVRYPGGTEEEMIKGIEKSLSDKPKYLIVMAPMDSRSKIHKIIQEAKSYIKIVTFNFKVNGCSSVQVDYQRAFQDLNRECKKINYVYDDKKDLETFIDRINKIKKNKIDVKSSKIISKNEFNFFQSQKLYNKFGRLEDTSSILISYRKPIDYSKNVK